MQQPSDSIVADFLPVAALFLCGFAGWAGALVLKRRLRHRLPLSRPGHKKVDDELELLPGPGHKKVDDEPELFPGAAAESPEASRRPEAPRRQARRRHRASAGQEPESPAVAAAVAPGSPERAAAPADQDRPVAALPAEQAEAAPPVPEQAEEALQSDRVTTLLAKKAARKARKAAEAEAEKEHQEQLSAVAPTAGVKEQQPFAAAAPMVEADEEQPLAAAAPMAEAEGEQPPLVTAATPMAEPEEEQPLAATAAADAAEETAGQDGGDGPERVLWATQEEDEGEWTNGGPQRPRLPPPLPPLPEGARGAQCAYGDHRSPQPDFWAGEHGGGAWKRGPGRWRGGGGWRGEAQEQDSWMAPFDTLPRAAPQQHLLQSAQAPVVSPIVCPDGQTAFCDGSRMYTPVGGSGGVFTDGEQIYEIFTDGEQTFFQVTLPLQDPGSPPGMEGLGHGFMPAGEEEEEFDPYDPAGLAPRGYQEQRWNGDDAGWNRSWGEAGWSRGSWDPSW